MKRIHNYFLLYFLGVISVATTWAEVGPEVIEPVAWGDLNGIRRYYDRMMLVAADNNYMASVIAGELKTMLWMDRSYAIPRSGSERGPSWSGSEVDRDWLAEVTKRAEAGDAFYMTVLGQFWQGHMVVIGRKWEWRNIIDGAPVDQAKVLGWWEKAAALNCGLAQFKLGLYYISTRCKYKDYEKSAPYIRQAAEWGIPSAWYWLGSFYGSGSLKEGVDIQKAMECWAKGAPNGDAECQFFLGINLLEGNDWQPPNKDTGLHWISASASNGYWKAQQYIENFVDKPHIQRTLPVVIEDRNTDVSSSIIAFDKIGESIRGVKVAVVCLIDDYELQAVRPAVLPDKTSSNMLDIYLSGLRTLKGSKAVASGGEMLAPKDVQIFIIECGGDIRAKVWEFDKQYHLKKYDKSIPVIYVFHSGKFVRKYTYFQNPGRDGGDLKSLVENLLTGNVKTNGNFIEQFLNNRLKSER